MGYIIKRLVLALIFGLIGVGISAYFTSQRLSKFGGFEGVTRLFKIYELRKHNPLLTQGQIAEILKNKEGHQPNQESHKSTHLNQFELPPHSIANRPEFRDPAVRERILQMAIPDEMKALILKNYEATGFLPNPEQQKQISEQNKSQGLNRKPAQSLDDLINEI